MNGHHLLALRLPERSHVFEPQGAHALCAVQELPGEFTTFDFVPGIPAPLNFALAILMNDKMLTLSEKLQCLPALLPMLIEGQVCAQQ